MSSTVDSVVLNFVVVVAGIESCGVVFITVVFLAVVIEAALLAVVVVGGTNVVIGLPEVSSTGEVDLVSVAVANVEVNASSEVCGSLVSDSTVVG